MAYCGHCGRYVKDGTEICPECGCYTQAKAETKNSSPTVSNVMLKSERPNYKFILICKLVFCVLGIILGLVIVNYITDVHSSSNNIYSDYDYSNGDASYAEFGTDYYTYVYKALKLTSENTEYTAKYAAKCAQDLATIAPILKITGVGFGLFITFLSAFAAIKSIGTYKNNMYKSTQFEMIIGALNKNE